MGADLEEYEALVAKVDAGAGAIAARRAADLSCRAGCHECCLVELTVLPVEAALVAESLEGLPEAEREAIAERAEQAPRGRCVFLGEEGTCAVYAARPLVCRTQGHALRYEDGVVPVEAVRARAGGDVVWCHLNYGQEPPAGADVLDASLLSRLLFVVNRRFAEARGVDPDARVPLRTIAFRSE